MTVLHNAVHTRSLFLAMLLLTSPARADIALTDPCVEHDYKVYPEGSPERRDALKRFIDCSGQQLQASNEVDAWLRRFGADLGEDGWVRAQVARHKGILWAIIYVECDRQERGDFLAMGNCLKLRERVEDELGNDLNATNGGSR